MKAVTVSQPWASAIMTGDKVYETRTWSTKWRGQLALHCSAKFTPADRAIAQELFMAGTIQTPLELMPTGAVIGIVTVLACDPTHLLMPSLKEAGLGDWSHGRFAWMLQVDRIFAEPIPAGGALGLWEWTPPA